MDYREQKRHPGSPIKSGSDMFKEFGYTDTQNPYVGFSLMNDSNYEWLRKLIEDQKVPPDEIPIGYNSNIIRLRDYRLGTMINAFREFCQSVIPMYEDAWHEYQKEYNASMPEDFYNFWYLSDKISLETIFPNYVNLIDPISMEWIDPQYAKVKCVDGVYQYQLDEPIMTSDARFLYKEITMEYEDHTPDHSPPLSIIEEVEQDMFEYIPDWMMCVDQMNHDLTYIEPNKNESREDFIKRIKFGIRAYSKNKRRYPRNGN